MNTPLPYNLRIGVTGHRNLADPKAVRQSVDVALEQIAQLLAHANQNPQRHARARMSFLEGWLTAIVAFLLRLLGVRVPWGIRHVDSSRQTPVQWTIVSPLAKGADRIVAEAVLALENSRLQVVTPLPVDEYRRDFKDELDRAEFERLLTLDPQPVILNADYPHLSAQNSEARNEAYLSVGRHVADRCELLIAVWDGQPAAGRGGTGDVVQYAVNKGGQVLWINVRNPQSPLYMLSNRLEPGATEGPLPGLFQRPLPQRARELSLGFHKLAAYQRDNAHDAPRAAAKAEQHRERLTTLAQKTGLPLTVVQPSLDALLPLYAQADQMAALYQGLYVLAARLLFRLSAAAVTVVVFQLLFFPHILGLIWLEIAAMLATLALLRVSQSDAWHEKWLGDRHLAEWLRTRMFAVLVGRPVEPPVQPLPFYRGPENWYLDAFGPVVDDVRHRLPRELPLDSLKQFLVEGWLRQQADWHKGNAHRKEHAAHRRHRLGALMFGLTLVMAVLHLAGVGHDLSHGSVTDHEVGHSMPATSRHATKKDEHHVEENHIAQSHDAEQHSNVEPSQRAKLLIWLWTCTGCWITFLAIVLPAWGAAIHAVGNLLDEERIAERSRHMGVALAALAQRAEAAATHAELRSIVAEAERTIAAENHEWLASLSFHGLVLPA